MKEKFTTSEKMVCVAGMMIPESKVEGRMSALANGRRIKAEKEAALAATRREEKEKMRKAGWSDDEITQHFLAMENEEARSHGFFEPTPRIKRTSELPYGPAVMFH